VTRLVCAVAAPYLLLARRELISSDPLPAADQELIVAALDEWTDVHAISNLCAERASVALVPLMRAPAAPDVLRCLSQASVRVRHNLLQGLLAALGTAGLATLLDEPDSLEPGVLRSARDAVASAGIDLAAPAEDQRRPLLFVYLANYADFDPADIADSTETD
jgi:hypothetical protein